nr:hypothetical protein [Tanacetum cinerariifolium]
MATMIEKQVALDKALVPSIKRHSAQIKTLTDVNINKLFQPWRSFGAVINKCLTGKSFGFDSFRDDILFSTIKVVSRHQNTQQYGTVLPIELTNEDIRNTKAYKEYYAYASREAAPKPKASTRRKKSGSDSSTTPPTTVASLRPTIAVTPRLTAAAKGKQPAKAKSPSDPSELARTEAQQLKIDVPSDDSEEEISWNSLDDEETDTQEQNIHDDEGDEKDESDDGEEDDDDDKDGDEKSENNEESDDEETREEESLDLIPRTPEDSEDDGNGEEDQGLRISKEERLREEKEADELYRDVDINQGRGLQLSQDIEDSHVTLTPVHSDGMESIFATASSPMARLQTSTPIMTPSTIATITTLSHAPIPPTTIPSEVLQNLPTFDSMNEAVRVAVQIQTDRLCDSYQRENDEFLRTIDDNIKRIIKEQVKSQVKDQVSRILPRIEQSVNAQLESDVLTRLSHSSRTSYVVAADLSEMELKKFLIEKIEGNKSAGRSTIGSKSRQASASESIFAEEPVQTTSQIEEPSHPVFETAAEDQPIVQTSQHPKWFSQSKKPPTPDHTPIDFSNFIMNRLGVDTLTPELLAGPTYELMKGSCKILTELEYHLVEVYKATTDQLDWINPEGQQYPHNLLHPLLLIPDNRGRRVIPLAHFINNDLEYLRGGASSCKYTTSVTKTKEANYGNIKWIEDLDVYKEYRHPATCGRSSTGSRKLPEEAQPYQARHVPIRSEARRSQLSASILPFLLLCDCDITIPSIGIREVLLMLEILSRRFFLKLNLSDHTSVLTDLQKSIAIKAKIESSDDEVSTLRSEDEEYAMAVRDIKNSSKDEESS